MTDRELLELAAKAAGYEFISYHVPTQDMASFLSTTWNGECAYVSKPDAPLGTCSWNPLNSDSDALQLAIALQLVISNEHLSSDACCVRTLDDSICITERVGKTGDKLTTDDYRATRRAIVRAAAEIGKAMP